MTQSEAAKIEWAITGQWFDLCSCTMPCGCTMAQPPTNNECYGTLVYKIENGHFGDLDLGGLTVVTVSLVKSENFWDSTKPISGVYDLFIDEQADERQRDALERLWTGKEGGWIANLVSMMGTLRNKEYALIECHIEDDLARWSIRIPGRINGEAVALSGPTTPPGKRVQTHNPPGSETGGSPATWAVPTTMDLSGFGELGEWKVNSSKHIPFDWKSE